MSVWKRARSPEQKAERRRSILASAAEMFVQRGFDAATMSAIARHARLCKGNLYRYFRTKEEIFLAIYLQDMQEWIQALDRMFWPAKDSEKSNDINEISSRLAESLLSRPRLAAMMPLLATVLERKVDRARLLSFKRDLLGQLPTLVAALRSALPQLDEAAAGRTIRLLHTLFAGLWPLSHPSADLVDIMQRPEFAAHRPDWERDLKEGIHVVLAGVLATTKP